MEMKYGGPAMFLIDVSANIKELFEFCILG